MASRWMNQMRQRERQFKKRQGMISMTDAERKLYRRKVIMFPNGRFKVESLDDYIDRIEQYARWEQKYAQDWWRHLARVLTSVPAPLDMTERDMISRACKEGWEVAKTQQAILRYRRLTGRSKQFE